MYRRIRPGFPPDHNIAPSSVCWSVLWLSKSHIGNCWLLEPECSPCCFVETLTIACWIKRDSVNLEIRTNSLKTFIESHTWISTYSWVDLQSPDKPRTTSKQRDPVPPPQNLLKDCVSGWLEVFFKHLPSVQHISPVRLNLPFQHIAAQYCRHMYLI